MNIYELEKMVGPHKSVSTRKGVTSASALIMHKVHNFSRTLKALREEHDAYIETQDTTDSGNHCSALCSTCKLIAELEEVILPPDEPAIELYICPKAAAGEECPAADHCLHATPHGFICCDEGCKYYPEVGPCQKIEEVEGI